MKTYKYKDIRTFRIGVTHEGTQIGDDGDLTVTLCIADDNDDLPKKIKEVREESRLDAHKNDIYWCFALTTDIDQLVAELHASRKMVEKYSQMAAQNRISHEENSCLQDEKNAVLNYQNRLRDKFTEAMEKGTGLFRGVSWDASSLGKAMSEIYKKLYGNVVPDLYPKLEMGSRPLKGDEAEVILKAADLKALPQVFYTGDKGLGLVTKEGQKYVPDPEAGTISISRTYSRRFGAGPPKSKHSKRTIRVPVVVGPILTAAAGSRDSGPLFLTGNGRPFAKSLVQRAFKRLLNNLGLTYRNVHQLRHSVATALISNGTPLGDVAKYLGDSVATVVKTYLHPSGANPAADLDRLFSSLPSVAVAETSTS